MRQLSRWQKALWNDVRRGLLDRKSLTFRHNLCDADFEIREVRRDGIVVLHFKDARAIL